MTIHITRAQFTAQISGDETCGHTTPKRREIIRTEPGIKSHHRGEVMFDADRLLLDTQNMEYGLAGRVECPASGYQSVLIIVITAQTNSKVPRSCFLREVTHSYRLALRIAYRGSQKLISFMQVAFRMWEGIKTLCQSVRILLFVPLSLLHWSESYLNPVRIVFGKVHLTCCIACQ